MNIEPEIEFRPEVEFRQEMDIPYRVWFAGAASRIVYVVCSVPKDSVLGPRLWSMM